MTVIIAILLGYAAASCVIALVMGRVLRHGNRLAEEALSGREGSSIETAHPPIEEKKAA
jgi:hypothetical protein